MGPKQMLMLHKYRVDDTADSLLDSMSHVQTTISELHSTVDELLKSMADILNSMAEMKAALIQPTIPGPTTESQVTVDQDLPSVDNPVDEKESRYTYLKKIQLEMPVFDGLNVYSWIPRAERYLELGNFTETEKLRLVYMSVEGEALNWFNFWKRRQPFIDWNDFKTRLEKRFGDFHSGSAFERLLDLKQVESVTAYLAQFEELAPQLTDNPDFSETLFRIGLKDEIQRMLSLFQPKGIDDLITKARRLENSVFCRAPTDAIDD